MAGNDAWGHRATDGSVDVAVTIAQKKALVFLLGTGAPIG